MGITEGNWEVDCDDVEVWVKSTNGEMICQLEWNLPRHGDVSLTNARAIAALPELVALLIKITNSAGEAYDMGNGYECTVPLNHLMDARDALRKAGLL